MVDDTTPAPWVFGRWKYLDEDRLAHQRGDPFFWTLLPCREQDAGVFCRGPYGRKSTTQETVIHACGYDTEGIDFDPDFLVLLLEKLNG